MIRSHQTHPSVSVVIPVLNAAAYLPSLLKALDSQKPDMPAEIILVDSGSTDGTLEIAAEHSSVRVVPITCFTHGRSRNIGIQAAKGDIILLMSQDARPANSQWMAALIAPLGHDRIVASFSRQIPNATARPMERFYLMRNFPDGPPVRREKAAHPSQELTAAFFSNVSSAMLRKTLLAFPFDETLILGEDQQFARDIQAAGFATLYQPSSVVIHSHRPSLVSLFKRYFDSVYALTVIFPQHALNSSAAVGAAYVREEGAYLARQAPLWLLYYPFYILAKTAATVLAHHVSHLPVALIRRLSMHSYHWQ